MLLLYLYAGLPKAAKKINHRRIWYGIGLALASEVTGDDVIYTPTLVPQCCASDWLTWMYGDW